MYRHINSCDRHFLLITIGVKDINFTIRRVSATGFIRNSAAKSVNTEDRLSSCKSQNVPISVDGSGLPGDSVLVKIDDRSILADRLHRKQIQKVSSGISFDAYI